MYRIHISNRRLVAAASACMVVLLGLGAIFGAYAPLPANAAVEGSAPRLRVWKFENGNSWLAPGGSASYVVVVANEAGVDAIGARILDPLAPGLANQAWTCTGFDGGVCANASGVGNLDESLDGLVGGGSLNYEITANVVASPPAFVTNVATVTLPPGASCANGGTPPCRAQFAMGTGANLVVDQVASSTSLIPSGTAQYSITIDNAVSAGSADGTLVRSPLANGLTNASWTCNASFGAVCPAAVGSGSIEQTIATWPAGGRIIYAITATVAASPPPEIVQATAVIPVYGGTCGFAADLPPCLANTRLPTSAWLRVTKSAEMQFGGGTIVYAVSLINIGADAAGSVLSDALPAGVSAFTSWTCSAADGAVCPVAAGSGPINQTIAVWPSQGTLDYQISAQVGAAPPPRIDNTVSVMPPTGGICGETGAPPPCTATASVDALVGSLQISKNADRSAVAGGEAVVYTVEIANTTIATDASGSVFSDPLPPGIASFDSWVCDAPGMATCPALSGTGPINVTLTSFPPESSLIYTINATVAATPPAEVVNTATLMPPPGSSFGCGFLSPPPPCVATSSLPTTALLSVSKYADVNGVDPGGTINYLLSIYNFGADATNVQIDDPLPAGIASASWTCTTSGPPCPQASGTGGISMLLPVLSADTGLSYDVSATVAAVPPSVVTNTLTVTTPTSHSCLIGDTSMLTPPPCIAEARNDAAPLLELEQSMFESQLLAGGTGIYVISLHNLGGAAGGTTLEDPLPVGIERFDWTCAGFDGAVCPAFSGSGALAETIATLPVNGMLVYTVQAVVAQGAPASITNVASTAPPAGGSCIPASCSVALTRPVSLVPAAAIRVTKQADVATADPGSTVTWTIDVSNRGAAPAYGLQISDPLPVGITAATWSCAGSGCPVASGTGAINQTVPALPIYSPDGPPGQIFPGQLVYTVVATVAAVPPAVINNIVTATPAAGDTCADAVCTATSSLPTGVAGEALLELAQSASVAELVAGAGFDYTIAITNTGNADAGQVLATNAVPAGIASFAWTCAGAGGAICPTAAGSGAINDVIAAIPIGASLTYTIAAIVAAAPPATVTNTFSVTPAPPASCQPASCVSTLALPTVAGPQAMLALAKSADRPSLDPGGAVVYTLSVTNTGTADAAPSVLADPLPAGLTGFTWTCAAINDATCPAAAGSGAINQTIAVPVASGLTWTVQASVAANPPAIVTNIATLTPGIGVTCNPVACSVQRALPVTTTGGAQVVVGKSASPPAGSSVGVNAPITWTLLARNDGAATTAPLTLRDRLPVNVRDIAVTPDSGIACSTPAPLAGSDLVCTIAAGFIGERRVLIGAIVTGADAQGGVRNEVTATGADAPVCNGCIVVNPLAAPSVVDVALRNPRPFAAAGIPGTLVDVANLSANTAFSVVLNVEPASAQRLFAVYAGGCTATASADGSVAVSCPSPPSAQGITCAGSTCTIAQLGPNSAATLFVALNQGASASLRADAAGDGNPANNTIVLPIGGTP